MSITTEISRIATAASVINTKAVDMNLEKSAGVALSTSDKIESTAAAINSIEIKSGVVASTSSPSMSVSIPKGYHDGTSTVAVSVPVNHYYTGSTTPSSGDYNNGDLFLVI